MRITGGMARIGPCKWYVSIEQPECGKPGIAKVTVRTRVAEATVDLCAHHKKVHDDQAARIRQERSKKNRTQVVGRTLDGGKIMAGSAADLDGYDR